MNRLRQVTSVLKPVDVFQTPRPEIRRSVTPKKEDVFQYIVRERIEPVNRILAQLFPNPSSSSMLIYGDRNLPYRLKRAQFDDLTMPTVLSNWLLSSEWITHRHFDVPLERFYRASTNRQNRWQVASQATFLRPAMSGFSSTVDKTHLAILDLNNLSTPEFILNLYSSEMSRLQKSRFRKGTKVRFGVLMTEQQFNVTLDHMDQGNISGDERNILHLLRERHEVEIVFLPENSKLKEVPPLGNKADAFDVSPYLRELLAQVDVSAGHSTLDISIYSELELFISPELQIQYGQSLRISLNQLFPVIYKNGNQIDNTVRFLLATRVYA